MIKDILHKWCNIFGKIYATYTVSWNTTNDNPTTISFVGGTIVISRQYRRNGYGFVWYNVNSITDTFIGGVIPQDVTISRTTSPAGNYRGGTIRCIGSVLYLAVNGTVIFDNR